MQRNRPWWYGEVVSACELETSVAALPPARRGSQPPRPDDAQAEQVDLAPRTTLPTTAIAIRTTTTIAAGASGAASRLM